MPQTSYLLDNVAAVAGQVVELGRKLGKYAASEDIPAGRMCELHTDNTIRLYRGGKKAGVSMYRSAKDPAAYVSGEYVPLLRSGQIWVDFDGTAASAVHLSDVNFWGPDTTATKRGKATQASPTSASDAQIFNGGAQFFGTPTADTGIALLSLDLGAEQDDVPQIAPTLLSHSSNDFAIPTTSKNNQVIELNTTAANSTVSLPAALPDGTTLFIFANGTKNGHTLTFRDVTTAISAATTASKRVTAVAVKAGGAWGVSYVVGP